MSHLRVPIVVAVIGEGGSGGAIGIAVGDRLLMLENAFYSVISPEGCAAILWKDRAKAERAAEALKATAKDLLALGVVDAIVPEPLGGAHRDAQAAARNLGQAVGAAFAELERLPMERLLEERYQKFRAMGRYAQPGAGPAVA
jgi:acetyl-CoA carboxylase carboxyl transferase subunit alpha